MPVKIGGKRRLKIYLAEHREAAGLTQEQLASRLGTTAMTVSRWERGSTLMTTDTLAAIAYALKGDLMQPEDLYYHPDKPSPNQLLRGKPIEVQDAALEIISQSPEVLDAAMKMIRAIRK